jgi:hypothetical protein
MLKCLTTSQEPRVGSRGRPRSTTIWMRCLFPVQSCVAETGVDRLFQCESIFYQAGNITYRFSEFSRDFRAWKTSEIPDYSCTGSYEYVPVSDGKIGIHSPINGKVDSSVQYPNPRAPPACPSVCPSQFQFQASSYRPPLYFLSPPFLSSRQLSVVRCALS